MNLKIKMLRMFSNGVYFADDDDEKKERQICNAIMYAFFALLSFFSVLELFYGFYNQMSLNLIIFIVIIIAHHAVRKGFYGFAKLLFIQSIIVFLFLSNLFYNQSTSYIYLYIIVIVNIPIVFSAKDFKYTIFFIAQSLILFFIHIFFHSNLPNFFTANVENFANHKNFATGILIVFLTSFLFLNVIIIQYRESKLKKNKANLIDIQNKIKSQSQDLQQFGLAITHSLKTPLILTNGFLNKIRNNMIKNTGHELNNHYFKIIKDSNSLIEKYSEDLSAYNSVINTRNQLVRFDIGQIINDEIKVLTIRFEKAKISSEIHQLTINSNLLLFKIIIQTLIENAIMYNNSEVPTLLIHNVTANNKITIYFKDNGIGITKEFRDNIFLPFVRINSKANVKGSGLGLSSAKIACDKIGAKLSLFESSNNGSIFKLELAPL